MENDSTSQTSPAWPTHWPKNSFRAGWTLGFIVLVAIILGVVTKVAVSILAARDPSAIAALLNACGSAARAFIPDTLVQVPIEVVVVAAILIGLPLLTKFSLRQLGFRALSGRTIGYAIAGTIAMLVVTDIGGAIGSAISPAKEQEQAVQILLGIHNPHTFIIFVVFAVVLAPIFEETLFRVFFFNLGLRYARFWGGAILSGVLFGLAHWDACNTSALPMLLSQVIPLAFGGMVLCWVYYRSRNAYASMISHALFNAISTAALYFFPKLAGG